MHSSMTTIFPITLHCPICKSKFGSNEIGSCGYASKRADFRPNYWGMNPVYYFYHLCPECGYCGSRNTFEFEINDEKLREKVEALESLKDPSLSTKLERAMNCLELLNDHGILKLTEFDLGNRWIEFFWWSEGDKAIMSGERVIEYFKQSLEKDLVPDDEISIIKYLIGEISRRIGNKEQAKTYFDEVISSTTNEEFIHELAVRQSTEPQENLKST